MLHGHYYIVKEEVVVSDHKGAGELKMGNKHTENQFIVVSGEGLREHRFSVAPEGIELYDVLGYAPTIEKACEIYQEKCSDSDENLVIARFSYTPTEEEKGALSNRPFVAYLYDGIRCYLDQVWKKEELGKSIRKIDKLFGEFCRRNCRKEYYVGLSFNPSRYLRNKKEKLEKETLDKNIEAILDESGLF